MSNSELNNFLEHAKKMTENFDKWPDWKKKPYIKYTEEKTMKYKKVTPKHGDRFDFLQAGRRLMSPDGKWELIIDVEENYYYRPVSSPCEVFTLTDGEFVKEVEPEPLRFKDLKPGSLVYKRAGSWSTCSATGDVYMVLRPRGGNIGYEAVCLVTGILERVGPNEPILEKS